MTRKLPVPRPLPSWFPALSAPFSVEREPVQRTAGRAGHREDVPVLVLAARVGAQIRPEVVLGEVVRQRVALAVVGRLEVAVALVFGSPPVGYSTRSHCRPAFTP